MLLFRLPLDCTLFLLACHICTNTELGPDLLLCAHRCSLQEYCAVTRCCQAEEGAAQNRTCLAVRIVSMSPHKYTTNCFNFRNSNFIVTKMEVQLFYFTTGLWHFWICKGHLKRRRTLLPHACLLSSRRGHSQKNMKYTRNAIHGYSVYCVSKY